MKLRPMNEAPIEETIWLFCNDGILMGKITEREELMETDEGEEQDYDFILDINTDFIHYEHACDYSETILNLPSKTYGWLPVEEFSVDQLLDEAASEFKKLEDEHDFREDSKRDVSE